jgi:predicted ester cyclase
VAASIGSNKDLVRGFVAAWNDRAFDRFREVMAEGAVLHIGGSDISCDPAATATIAEQWTTAFPDWRFEILALIAEGDMVAAHLPYSGTHREPILGIEPTERHARVDEMVIFRIADGKIAEAWEVYDECGMWRQLGVQPHPA